MKSFQKTSTGVDARPGEWKRKGTIIERKRQRKYLFIGDFADEALINRSMARAAPNGYIANPMNAFLINEELGRRMGGNDLVGKRLRFLGVDGVIIGVMKDFHFHAVQRKIERPKSPTRLHFVS